MVPLHRAFQLVTPPPPRRIEHVRSVEGCRLRVEQSRSEVPVWALRGPTDESKVNADPMNHAPAWPGSEGPGLQTSCCSPRLAAGGNPLLSCPAALLLSRPTGALRTFRAAPLLHILPRLFEELHRAVRRRAAGAVHETQEVRDVACNASGEVGSWGMQHFLTQ